MPLIATRGASSVQGFGQFAQSAVPNYIEDVFSTWLYSGNASTQTITNGINLSTKGGLVWGAIRSGTIGTFDHIFTDTVRGTNPWLASVSTNAQNTAGNDISSFNNNGFSLNYTSGLYNETGNSMASWTFRKQAKFFDVVTYTGTGVNRTIAHSLNSVPACIIVKRTDATGAWQVYHSSLANTEYLVLNTTAAKATGATRWNSTTPTSSVFSVGTDATVNANGGTYVAYIYASNAGGFGLTGTDNVISCGSYTGNGSTTGPVVTLGYEPQWILVKNTTTASADWNLADNMRGLWVGDTTITGHSPRLRPNSSVAEQSSGWVIPTATGFQLYGANAANVAYNASGDTYIYIAIRRGPMKVPTDATKVFYPSIYTGTGAAKTLTSNFAPDVSISSDRSATYAIGAFLDKLRGYSAEMQTWTTNSESTYSGSAATEITAYTNTGVTLGTSSGGAINASGTSYVDYLFQRAPSFFDEVCYTGDGTNMTLNHNLGVVPELMFVKRRSITGGWFTYSAGTTTPNNYYLQLQSTAAQVNAGAQVWNNTATTFLAGTGLGISAVGQTYVAYLFATCAGVSKVGSYTGTGTLTTINCGFTGGARFVLIKRTDTTGGWYFWDTVRGMVAGTDPSLRFSAISAEANANSAYTITTGFQLLASPAVDINTNGGTYIFLAIA
jgi:hypothetical protein